MINNHIKKCSVPIQNEELENRLNYILLMMFKYMIIYKFKYYSDQNGKYLDFTFCIYYLYSENSLSIRFSSIKTPIITPEAINTTNNSLSKVY